MKVSTPSFRLGVIFSSGCKMYLLLPKPTKMFIGEKPVLNYFTLNIIKMNKKYSFQSVTRMFLAVKRNEGIWNGMLQ